MGIGVFAAGGTIAKVYFDAKVGYQVGAPMVLELLRHARLPTLPQVTELLRKDSLEMTAVDRQAIRTAAAACEATQILITHGTDTIVETARELAGPPRKTIVLTGALQPRRFGDRDAAF